MCLVRVQELTFTHLILTTALGGRSYSPHFTDEDMEAQRGVVGCKVHCKAGVSNSGSSLAPVSSAYPISVLLDD